VILNGADVATLLVTTKNELHQTPVFEMNSGVQFVELESLDGAHSPGSDPRRLSVALFRVDLESSP
jgi:hypothetical protein